MRFYRCDPEKYTKCPKTECGTHCGITRHKKYSVDGHPLSAEECGELQKEIDERRERNEQEAGK